MTCVLKKCFTSLPAVYLNKIEKSNFHRQMFWLTLSFGISTEIFSLKNMNQDIFHLFHFQLAAQLCVGISALAAVVELLGQMLPSFFAYITLLLMYMSRAYRA